MQPTEMAPTRIVPISQRGRNSGWATGSSLAPHPGQWHSVPRSYTGLVSVPVEVDQLRQQIKDAGSAAFLISVREGGRPHVVSVSPQWKDARLVMTVGGRTAGNVARHPSVTLLWPTPGQDYSLIVDGIARVGGDLLEVEPVKAVLHRSVLASPSTGHGEGDDPQCIPVLG